MEAEKNIRKCTTILLKKILDCECGDTPPNYQTFYPKILPQKIPIPTKHIGIFNWKNDVLPVIIWSGVTVGLIFCPFDGPIGEVTTGSTSIYYWH